MVKTEENVEKSSKRSLLDKYEIPVENLSYEYITQCTNPKELERIIMILRSGEEGFYPDLNKHAEARLISIKPESSLLRIAEPVLTRNELEPEKRMKLDNDINEWMSEMKMREKDLEEGRAMQINEAIPQPAVRQITFDESKKKKQSSEKTDKNKRIGACDYAGWDKYDADTELNRIDLKHEKKQADVKMAQKKLQDKEDKMKKTSRETIVNKLSLTGTELIVMAENERKKGNEAFKSGDYEEALQFYNSSIAIDATINSYNNRAITYIKLERYKNAVDDCNTVMTMDYTNIKALLRRGLAQEHLEKKAQALADYEAVLKLEPSNKIAIAALNKLRQPCDSKKIRMKIEEGPETDETSSVKMSSIRETKKDNSSCIKSKTGSEKSKNVSSNVKVQESSSVSSKNLTNNNKSSQVCFCDNAPTSSQYSSPQPHIRDIYCPQTPQNFAKFPKPQSIFTDTKNSSGVIIEEIPNDSWESSEENLNYKKNDKIGTKKNRDTILKNFETGDNGGINRKSSVIIEELPQENFNLKDVAKKDEKNCEFFAKKPKNSNYFSKSQFFSRTQVSSQKSSGVIIEEIPNESPMKSAAHFDSDKIEEKSKKLEENKTMIENFASGDNGEISKKYGVVIEEISTESYKNQNDLKNGQKVEKKSSNEPKSMAKIEKLQNIDNEHSSEKSSATVVEKMADEQNEELEKKSIPEKNTEKQKNRQKLNSILNVETDEKEKIDKKSDAEKKILEEKSKVETAEEIKNDKNCSKRSKKHKKFKKPQKNDNELTKQSSAVIVNKMAEEPDEELEKTSDSEKNKEKPKNHQEFNSKLDVKTDEKEKIDEKSDTGKKMLEEESKVEKVEEIKYDKNCSKGSKKSRKKKKIIKLQKIENELSKESSAVIVNKVAQEPNEEFEKKSNSEKNKEESKNHQDSNSILNSGTDEKEKIEKKTDDEKKLFEEESKVETMEETKFDTIESPYEFLRIWHSLRKDHDLILHAKLLNALPPENIDTVIGNKLDGAMLSTIIRCFEAHFCNSDNSKHLSEFLRYLGGVKRFSLVRMFMDVNDKKVLRNIFSFLEGQESPNIVPDLRKIYDVPM